VAYDLAELLVDAQEAALDITVSDADPRVLERAAEPLLALAQRFLGPPSRLDEPDEQPGHHDEPEGPRREVSAHVEIPMRRNEEGVDRQEGENDGRQRRHQ